MTKLDILAFGAHPDDVEIGMAGTLVKYTKKGYNVGICDLTMAELSSNGTVERRQAEAKRAGEYLGLHTRIQLDFPDRGLRHTGEEQMRELVSIIRYYQPSIVFAPYSIDRHPDHGECGKLVKEAVFNAGIRKYRCTKNLGHHRVKDVYFYLINSYERPDFVIDISDYIETKKLALQAYESQFVGDANSIETPLTNGYIEVVEARERLFGKEVSVDYAEGFKVTKPFLVKTLIEEDERTR
ncbi:bacillithiol biosynthesis deacetylase BshB1 [Halalkalibacter urbisdiaboli]|uniref:bacillithiol biosynthesis deacetylase BshB1 n=1 Tax=Halalkalibacter urbisdiaboli TaxID=1960589 RepID=UPI000B4354ED|nr:bacillithiol biosynthesis deacetylase BshB1 [Halalkalibacter urbisdiaboli]